MAQINTSTARSPTSNGMNTSSLIRRICLTGSECTGKSTLARELAARLHAPLVPEYAREYAERRGGMLGPRDVQPIAQGHLASEARALQKLLHDDKKPFLILDTDLISTVVYS